MAKKIEKKNLSKLFVSFGIALFVVVLTQWMSIPFLHKLELRLTDERFLRRGPLDIGASADVVILEITQDSYNQIPPPNNAWPWPRNLFANVIENLEQAGVRAIGIDIVMSNPDRFSSENDNILKDVIRKNGNVVVAGKVDIAAERIEAQKGSYSGLSSTRVSKKDENFGSIFFEADSSIGIVQVPNDYDGVYRRFQPYVYSQITKRSIPIFASAVLNKYFILPSMHVPENREEEFQFGPITIPKYDRTSMLINFYGASRSFPHYKFIDVLDDKDFKTIDEIDFQEDINTWDNPEYGLLYQNIFHDKIVLIGSTMPEDKDFFPISFSAGAGGGDNLIYGVEYHANVIQNIIRKDFLIKQSKSFEIVFLVCLVIITFVLSSLFKGRKTKFQFLFEIGNLLIVGGIIFAIFEIGMLVFVKYNYVITIVYPVMAVVISYLGSTVYHFVIERQQNKMIRGMFSHYVSGELVTQLLQDPDKLKLGGEKREISVLFSDIAGFTTFSENLDPEELVDFINRYLTEMTDIVLKNNGTLDKYEGDAIMAFWGAPMKLDNHEYLACKAAVDMQKRLVMLREEWNMPKEKEIKIRIGINSGEMVVGNIGGKTRFDYTVMGDNVNLASRLEGANKQYGSGVMISEMTYEKVKDKIVARELDKIRVKGKKKPTRVFELLGIIGDPEADLMEVNLEHYREGLEFYKEMNFEKACEMFSESTRKLNGDQPSEVYLDRCKSYIENPPAEDWDGVFELKSK